ncbi:MAG: isoprenyl transferase [Deltaproteobacteria bacterium]|nr:isoprenyl transferase [Deltaproteobacteria bacterium]
MSESNGNHSSTNGSSPALPRHIAIIMDGNGRWAKRRFLPRVEGHRQGAKAVRRVVEESVRLGIRYLTLFAFSTENWRRPSDEVSSLMKLFLMHLESEVDLLKEHSIRLRAIGDLERLPAPVASALERCMTATQEGTAMDLVLAISYGGREEIVSAARRIAAEVKSGALDIQSIDEVAFSTKLYAPDIPDPDLLIRTSDENRISNFLLWQLAYSEIVLSPVLWPDFSKEEYMRCLEEYARRERRFGLTREQMLELRTLERSA